MNVYRRLLAVTHREGTGPRRRGDLRLEFVSLFAVLLLGALALGTTSVNAEETGSPDDQAATADIATRGGVVDAAGSVGNGVVIKTVQAIEGGPDTSEFVNCMREQGIELPEARFDGNGSPEAHTIPLGESVALNQAYVDAAEQCGQTVHAGEIVVADGELEMSVIGNGEFTQCLSDAGIELPTRHEITPGDEPSAGSVAAPAFDLSDPETQAAFERCGELLPGSVGVVTSGD